jgi:nucleotidyltransferase/DNA polymerase involved in DNA repair
VVRGVVQMLAKLAGEVHKPDQQTTILPQFAHAFLAPMPVRKLPGCGWAINKQLQVRGSRGSLYTTHK